MFSFLQPFRKKQLGNGPRSQHKFAKSVSRVYLDHAGATEVSAKSAVALLESLALYGNPSGIHHEGALAGKHLDLARANCASVLNSHAYEIYFVGSGTESCNLAVLGVYSAFAKSQKLTANSSSLLPHMIISSVEHPAIMEPVRMLEREGKIRVTYLPVYDDGIVKVSDVMNALTPETILISVMYANNEIGTLQPIKEIGKALDEWKRTEGESFTSYPYFHTDACQAANYCDLDVVRLRVHMMTVNSSKVYGPKGSALLYKREGVEMRPVTLGGGQERELRSGTENVAGAYAFSVALKETAELRDKESKRLRVLRDAAVRLLKNAVPSIVIYGASDEYRPVLNKETGEMVHVLYEEKRLPNNINCRVPGISSEEMILRLDAKGFSVSHKSACASMETDGSYVIEALGGTAEEAKENIRISMGRGTTMIGMERLVEEVKEISEKYCH